MRIVCKTCGKHFVLQLSFTRRYTPLCFDCLEKRIDDERNSAESTNTTTEFAANRKYAAKEIGRYAHHVWRDSR